jgi:uncharacterized protein (TIGR02996 family)
MTHDAFLQAIVASPGDDNPRLIYADWLEERGDRDRAEFIRVQCDLAQLSKSDPRRRQPERREQELLALRRQEWVAPLGGTVRNVAFERGLVARIELDADEFLTHAASIFSVAPVTHAAIGSAWDDTSRTLALLASCPSLERLTTIDLRFGCYFINDDGLQTLAHLPPLLQRLNSLWLLECDISPVGLDPVLRSPHLRRLGKLHLSECGLSGALGVRALAESPQLRQLVYLDLNKNFVGDAGARLLAGSPNCSRLESLDLAGCDLTSAGAKALARSPYLRNLDSLWLADNRIGDSGAFVLARSASLANLRYLGLGCNRLTDAGARALAVGPSLLRSLRLSLYGNRISELCETSLKAQCGDRVICSL